MRYAATNESLTGANGDGVYSFSATVAVGSGLVKRNRLSFARLQ
jgi:hypothetical protein